MNNWLLWVIGGIILIGAIVGFAKGAVKILVSLSATIVTMALVFFLTPHVTKYIYELTPIAEMVEAQCRGIAKGAITGEESGKSGLTESQVQGILSAAGISEEELAAAGITVQDIVEGKVTGADLKKMGFSSEILAGHVKKEEAEPEVQEMTRQEQIQIIEGSNLPKGFKELLLTNNNSEMYNSLGAETFSDYLIKYLAKIIINICTYLIMFLIVLVVIRAIVFALDFVTELPVLGVLNRLAGMMIGVSLSMVVVGFFYVVVMVVYSTKAGTMIIQQTEASSFLKTIYDGNLIMAILTRLM